MKLFGVENKNADHDELLGVVVQASNADEALEIAKSQRQHEWVSLPLSGGVPEFIVWEIPQPDEPAVLHDYMFHG